jgi:hypothetical protein
MICSLRDSRLLKNTRLSRHASGLRSFPIAIAIIATCREKYAAFLRISRAVYLFNNPAVPPAFLKNSLTEKRA